MKIEKYKLKMCVQQLHVQTISLFFNAIYNTIVRKMNDTNSL